MISLLVIIVLASFAYGSSCDDHISLRVVPEVPKEDAPVIVTFFLHNPESETQTTHYQFYANGQLLMSGSTVLGPGERKQFQYTYLNPLMMGEQLTFVVKTQSDCGDHDMAVSLPAYPPRSGAVSCPLPPFPPQPSVPPV